MSLWNHKKEYEHRDERQDESRNIIRCHTADEAMHHHYEEVNMMKTYENKNHPNEERRRRTTMRMVVNGSKDLRYGTKK